MAVLNNSTQTSVGRLNHNVASFDQYPDADDKNLSFGMTNDHTVVDNKPINRPTPGGFALIPLGPVGGVRG